MNKYEINKEFERYSDIRQFTVDAEKYEHQDGYFIFYSGSKKTLSIIASEVRTIRPLDGPKDSQSSAPRA